MICTCGHEFDTPHAKMINYDEITEVCPECESTQYESYDQDWAKRYRNMKRERALNTFKRIKG